MISLLLAQEQYPWTFVVTSSDAMAQLLAEFPVVISTALNVDREFYSQRLWLALKTSIGDPDVWPAGLSTRFMGR